jgi:hypothetical protein
MHKYSPNNGHWQSLLLFIIAYNEESRAKNQEPRLNKKQEAGNKFNYPASWLLFLDSCFFS